MSHEKRLEFFNPSDIILFLNLLFSNACIASCILGISNLSKAIPSLPIISDIEELLPAITGQPALCASITGIPKPSYKDGYNRQKD